MRRVKSLLAVLALAALWFTPVVAAAQEPPSVLQVILVDVAPTNVDAYVAELGELQGLLSKAGLSPIRVWQSTLAGPNTGTIAITIESKNLAGFAANTGKIQASPEIQKWLDELQEKGLGDLVSNSLLVDRTP
ncbi:MAG: hypothetical protein ABFS46_17450 [Myxococcota bacterium]